MHQVLRGLTAALIAIGVAGCSNTLVPDSPHPSPTPTTSRSARTSPSAAPDTEQVQVIASGVGDYDLQAIPVVVLHNLAVAHTAGSVLVQFAVHHPGGTYDLDAMPVSIAPGETLAVAALCTFECERATGTDASLSIGGWTLVGPPALEPSAASYGCGSPCAGVGGFEGDATGTLTGTVTLGKLVDVFASCSLASGTIVGGGVTEAIWDSGTMTGRPATQTVEVPVLTTAQPASCEVYGSVAV
jgi:hypothetical protein